jgi:hypothetical protein
MDIYDFLLYKKNLTNILICTESIINSYTNISDMMNNIFHKNNNPDVSSDIRREIFKLMEIRLTYDIKKTEIEQQIINCDNDIYKCCDHFFVEDYIDVTPDISKKIIYCTICELSKRDNIPLSKL